METTLIHEAITIAGIQITQAINRLVPPGAPVNTREQVNVVCEAIELIRNNHPAEAAQGRSTRQIRTTPPRRRAVG